jgi:hypothetical protein
MKLNPNSEAIVATADGMVVFLKTLVTRVFSGKEVPIQWTSITLSIWLDTFFVTKDTYPYQNLVVAP